MKPSLLAKLQQLAERLEAVDRLLSEPDSAQRMDEFRKLSKERADLAPVVEELHAYTALESDLTAAQEWLQDPELKAFAQDEITRLKTALDDKTSELQRLLLPKDPNDDRNVILERLKIAGVPTAVHYPVPVHLQPAYKNLFRISGSLKNAELVAERVFSLPMHPYLAEADQVKIVGKVVEAINL